MRLLQCCFLLAFLASVQSGTWIDDDTVVIEAPKDDEIDASRIKRQTLQYPGWPSGFPGFPRPPTGSRPGIGSCYTANGREGECATFRQCFPFMYSIEDGEDNMIQNPGLAEFLNETAGPCESPVMANYFYFKADTELRQSLICCSQNKRPGYPYPPLKPIARPTVRTTTSRIPVVNPYPPVTNPRPPVTISTRPPSTIKPRPDVGQRPPPSPSDSPKVDTPSNCGQSFVVGGSESSKGKHPWIVALTNNGRQFCGGSLISSYFILTAAHCVSHMTSVDIARLRVNLGDHTLGVGESTEQIEKVARVFYHRGFNQQTLHNDVALLKLQSPARETNYIRSVCLAHDTRQSFSTATLAGWGQIADGASQANTLREVTMEVWTNDRCKATYGGRAPGGIIPSMICAGSRGKDACRGDSGGPLLVQNEGIHKQVGIVSWGIGCGTYPGVYSRVTSFLPWIEKNRKM